MGIEEEYLLVDAKTRDLVHEPPKQLMQGLETTLQGRFSREQLRPQVEVGTSVCTSVQEARTELAYLRRAVSDMAGEHGLALIAASTHPFGSWKEHRRTDKPRYRVLQENLRLVAMRLLTCGMHVHIGIDDDNLRIDTMNQVSYFLPHLLALSTSSPFWEGIETGLHSYRLCVFDELPRTGLPERFESLGEYQRAVDLMKSAGLIEDASMLWWDVRPSIHFPTLEMRITDVCTRLDDAVCLAAFFRCVCRMLYRLRRDNQRWRVYARMLVSENRWRAQRYGIDRGMVDFGRGEIVHYGALMEELTEFIRPDAEHFDCVQEINHFRTILSRGTSSHLQTSVYRSALARGASHKEALREVVDALISATTEGI